MTEARSCLCRGAAARLLVAVLSQALLSAHAAADDQPRSAPVSAGLVENPFVSEAAPAKPAAQVDRLVFARLKKLKIEPALICSDQVFVRRVYLDVLGTFPTPSEANAFLEDKNPARRAQLVERLLARDEFADYWAMRWCDLLRVKAEFPINLWPNAAQAYHHWIRDCLRHDVPYDQFARGLLTSSGSNFRSPPVNFYRAVQRKEPQALAQAVALTFLGARAENWPSNQLAGLTAFFSQVGYKSTSEWKEEIVFFDPSKATNGLFTAAMFPDGTRPKPGWVGDPRELFARWLIQEKNPWFARVMVNRTWAWLLGRGIVEPADDMRPDNPPSNPELLAYLEREFIHSKYDFKSLCRLILNSQTYQLASISQSDSRQAAANFASYPLRRLDAEVLIDALDQVTGGTENYSSAIPEPFTYIPAGIRSISLPDASISSSFLEMFGRSPRDTGYINERNNRIGAEQRLHLLNSSHVQQKLQQSDLVLKAAQSKKAPADVARAFYLAFLSRYPTESETRSVELFFKTHASNRRDAVFDLAWSLVNSSEFLYRH